MFCAYPFLRFFQEIQELLELLQTSVEPWHSISAAWPKTFAIRQEKSKALANKSVEAWQITAFPCLSTESGFQLVCNHLLYVVTKKLVQNNREMS